MSKKTKNLEKELAEIKSLVEKLDDRVKMIELSANYKDLGGNDKNDKLNIGLFSSEVKEAVEKQIPQLVKRGATRTSGAQIMVEHRCPRCGQYLAGIVLKSYCDNCGQKLDWGETNL